MAAHKQLLGWKSVCPSPPCLGPKQTGRTEALGGPCGVSLREVGHSAPTGEMDGHGQEPPITQQAVRVMQQAQLCGNLLAAL